MLHALASCALAACLPPSPSTGPDGSGEPFATLEVAGTITHLEVAGRADLVVIAEESGLVRLLDARTLAERGRIDAAARPLDLAVTDDGSWIALRTAETTVTVWKAGDDEPRHALGHDAGAFAFVAGTSRLVLADTVGVVRSVDVSSGELGPITTFEDRRKIEGVEVSRDGRVVAFALDDG